ncbi:hypothetical protein Dsin_021569 [Dipteronia sinensis]|uniref:Uncharacterized protein n=1 Tax=Dipteronia sinensis TaxID=43782 RepID=A0AAE0A003_9ROSI|nr:hypothetical protein Dsin_021569 [Dipteronia sinensis]
MLTGIFGIIHQLAGGVSLESQGRGYEGSRSASETMGDKLHRREGNSPDHQLRPLNDRSVIKEASSWPVYGPGRDRPCPGRGPCRLDLACLA